ncbi:MAG: MiaB/RimO family radical SAM methylthiotransferase, partial [Clostridia bacterium]|nr:MiaB/RimO family radical SAM methylthiotransferase [Clostridia bacterium]
YPELLEADFIAGNRNKASVAENVERLLSGERLDMRESLEGAPYENLTIDSRRYVKAYVKIEDGCNNFCSYCYVPFVRGRVRSRKKEDIISEVSRLVDRGYREIILTGIETSSYGEDRDEKEPLLSLVEELQKKCHVERLRFGSLHPSYFTEERVKRLSSIEGVMPHFHLSVQSASTSVLEKMGRHYNRETLYGAVENIRRHFEDVNLSCDMICGFPEETDCDFEDSLRFIEDAEILHTHVFPYSQREGTRASKMQEVKTFVKHERARLMTKKAEEIHRRIFDKNIGREYNMMVEFFKNGKALGYTENFLNLSIPIPGNCEKGDIVRVKITPDMDR